MVEALRRAVRAALLRREVFRRTANDPEAILPALGVVVAAAMMLGLGLMNVVFEGTKTPEVAGIADRLFRMWMVVATMTVGWVLWGVAVHLLGGKFLGGKATFREVLRVLGICYGPGVLGLFVQVPGLGFTVYFVGQLWVLIAGIVASHEIQRTDWSAAILSTTLGWALFLVILPAIFIIFPYVG
jgi:hypothetical protein